MDGNGYFQPFAIRKDLVHRIQLIANHKENWLDIFMPRGAATYHVLEIIVATGAPIVLYHEIWSQLS